MCCSSIFLLFFVNVCLFIRYPYSLHWMHEKNHRITFPCMSWDHIGLSRKYSQWWNGCSVEITRHHILTGESKYKYSKYFVKFMFYPTGRRFVAYVRNEERGLKRNVTTTTKKQKCQSSATTTSRRWEQVRRAPWVLPLSKKNLPLRIESGIPDWLVWKSNFEI